jgi:hypothetical protein
MPHQKRFIALFVAVMMTQVACQGVVPVITPEGCNLVGVVGKPGGIGIGIPIFGNKAAKPPGTKVKKGIDDAVEPSGWAEVITKDDKHLGYAISVADLSSPVIGAEFIIEGVDEAIEIPAEAISQRDGTAVIIGSLEYELSDLNALQRGDWTLVISTEQYPDGEIVQQLAD